MFARPYLRNFGNLSVREILLITWPTDRKPIHLSVRTTGGPKCEMSNFLASMGACNLFLN